MLSRRDIMYHWHHWILDRASRSLPDCSRPPVTNTSALSTLLHCDKPQFAYKSTVTCKNKIIVLLISCIHSIKLSKPRSLFPNVWPVGYIVCDFQLEEDRKRDLWSVTYVYPEREGPAKRWQPHAMLTHTSSCSYYAAWHWRQIDRRSHLPGGNKNEYPIHYSQVRHGNITPSSVTTENDKIWTLQFCKVVRQRV